VYYKVQRALFKSALCKAYIKDLKEASLSIRKEISIYNIWRWFERVTIKTKRPVRMYRLLRFKELERGIYIVREFFECYSMMINYADE